MEIPDRSRQHHKIQHMRHAFTDGAASVVLVTAKGTGLNIMPIWYRYQASAAGSMTLFAGTAGASVFHCRVVTAGDERNGPWWDPTGVGANKHIMIEKEAGVGKGEFEIWYIVVRTGAGGSGTGQ